MWVLGLGLPDFRVPALMGILRQRCLFPKYNSFKLSGMERLNQAAYEKRLWLISQLEFSFLMCSTLQMRFNQDRYLCHEPRWPCWLLVIIMIGTDYL